MKRKIYLILNCATTPNEIYYASQSSTMRDFIYTGLENDAELACSECEIGVIHSDCIEKFPELDSEGD